MLFETGINYKIELHSGTVQVPEDYLLLLFQAMGGIQIHQDDRQVFCLRSLDPLTMFCCSFSGGCFGLVGTQYSKDKMDLFYKLDIISGIKCDLLFF